MASLDMDSCNLCKDDGTSTEAVSWCIECEVFLCTDCEKHHKKLRMSKSHNTMSTKDYRNLPKFIQEISSQCRDHKKKYELYCSFHACPCCVTCITDKHNKCQEMKPLSDILKQVKSSASVQLFEKDLKDVKENLEVIVKHLNSRINTSNSQKTKVAEQIRSMRMTIDDFLTKLEKDILHDLDAKQSELKFKMNTLLQQMNTQANQISQLQSEFSNLSQYATELQMYVGLREIEKTTSEAAKYIEDLKSGGKLDEINLELTISSELQSILKDVKSFGDIHINTHPFTLQVNAGRKDQAQYLVPTIPKIAEIEPSLLTVPQDKIKTGRKDQAQYLVSTFPGIERIKPSMVRHLTIPYDMKSINIFACRILNDGKYLILHSRFDTSKLLLFSNKGIVMGEVADIQSSHDTCFVKNNTVAVAIHLRNSIALVDMKTNEIFKSINLSHRCISVASDGQILVISNVDNCSIVDLKDMSQTILPRVKAYRAALFNGKIYGTIPSENKVCCYTTTGDVLWTYMHEAIDDPEGLALDKKGFVYIVSINKNSVVVVSPDGKTCKTILSKADGIIKPRLIDINREKGMMIVSGTIRDDKSGIKFYQTAFVYKI